MADGRGRRLPALVALAAALALTVVVPPAAASPGAASPEALVERVDPHGVLRHLRALQRIAAANGGTRASGTPGYDASAAYVAGHLEDAGYAVTRQEFEFEYAEDLGSTFAQVSPTPTEYELGVDFLPAQFSPTAAATGTVEGVDLVLPPGPQPGSTSGCEAEDFAGFTPGNVALVQRGTCPFALKALNAEAAGAAGVVVFNEGQEGRTGLFQPGGEAPGLTIPVVGTPFAIGDALAAAAATGQAVVAIEVDVLRETRTTSNVIAQTRTGRRDNVVMAGAHLDSVVDGPGINDNGSGSAGLLEIALELGGAPPVNNAVRFAWWGAEESGLLGSARYVTDLGFEDQLDIALYLNFDMIGSPNAGFFVYDGDDSDAEGAGPGPFGSAQIEQAFVEVLAEAGVTAEGTDFSGRSDYGPFIAVGIPAGGLFTGAEDIKTEEQQALWGGEAGVAFDPCYHQACDTLGNLDVEALAVNVDAAAWVIARYAESTTDVNGTGGRAARAAERRTARADPAPMPLAAV